MANYGERKSIWCLLDTIKFDPQVLNVVPEIAGTAPAAITNVENKSTLAYPGPFDYPKKDRIPSDLSNIETKHIDILIKDKPPAEVGVLLRKAAIAGSGDAAAFMSQLYLV